MAAILRRRPLRDRIRERLIDRAVEAGATREQVEQAIGDLEGDRPLLDWFLNGGFEKLLQMIMTLIGLFGMTQDEPE